MNDQTIDSAPEVLADLLRDSNLSGFAMASEPKTGALLRVLAASKPGGRFLEIGTGTGIGTAWLLAGMDASSSLDSVDNDDSAQTIARQHLGGDPRAAFHLEEGAQFLARQSPGSYDFIYADSWPGKFTHLDLALSLVRVGGLYLVDDLLPQPNWPEGHAPKVPSLIDELSNQLSFASVRLAWSSGLMLHLRCERKATKHPNGVESALKATQ
jgi:predicted O-methyltransferase YrrM